MKHLRQVARGWALVLGMFGMAILLTGCQTGNQPFEDLAGTPGTTNTTNLPDPLNVLNVGDSIGLTYSSPSTDKVWPPYDERIHDDGTITPPDIGSVKAAGRTVGDLQKEIQEKYDRLYKHLTVTVKAENRYFYVDGEVVRRGPYPCLDATDIVKAIAAAGGFTDFARKTKVKIIHAKNQKSEIINYKKIIEDPNLNVKVYPGDRIIVPRRIF
jgi:polysaccharide biosynthesis/export protein